MRYFANITLSSACVEAIANESHEKKDLLESQFKDNSVVLSLLSDYHDGAPITYWIRAVDVDKFGAGYVSVDYTVHRYSGCRDLNLDEENDMDIEIGVNMTTTEATLSGEDIPEREPDEY